MSLLLLSSLQSQAITVGTGEVNLDFTTPPRWTTVERFDQGTHIYLFYSGGLFDPAAGATEFKFDLTITVVDPFLITAISGEPAIASPEASHIVSDFKVSADKEVSITVNLEDRAEEKAKCTLHYIPVDLAVDADRSGTIHREDDRDKEDLWSKERGAIYAVNYDKDGDNVAGLEKRPDAIHFQDDGTSSDEDWEIEQAPDDQDITPFVIGALHGLPKDFKVILKVEELEDMRAIHLYKKIAPGEKAIWGSHKDPSIAPKPPWEKNDTDPNDLELDISRYVNPNHPDYKDPKNETGKTADGDHEFGIEGLLFRGMKVDGGTLGTTGNFSGEIKFTIDILDAAGSPIVTDSNPVRMKVAPWLMISRDEPSEEIWMAENDSDVEPFLDVENLITRLLPVNGHYSGISQSSQLHSVADFEEVGNRWFQDHLEIGFTQRPGGPKTHIAFRLPYENSRVVQPNWPVQHLLKKNVGIFQLGSNLTGGSGDFGGNLEILSPDDSHQIGMIVIGDKSSSDLQEFPSAQQFQAQPSVVADVASKWLRVGHIDEFSSFLSDNRVMISGARQAIELLESEIPLSKRAERLFFSSSWKTRTGVVASTSIDDPATADDESVIIIRTGRDHIDLGDTFKWIRFYSGAAKGHVAKIKLHNQYLEVDTIPGRAIPVIYFTGKSLSAYEKQIKKGGDIIIGWVDKPEKDDEFVLCEDTKFWAPTDFIDLNGDNIYEGMPAIITVKEVLEDRGEDNFVQFNKFDVQGVINGAEQAIRGAAGTPKPRFIPLPSLFFGLDLPSGSPGAYTGVIDGTSIAFTPGPTNLQPVNGSLYIPKQFSPMSGPSQDIFETAIIPLVTETIYFTDCWDAYHRYAGEIHCGSNVKRKIPSWEWWIKINP